MEQSSFTETLVRENSLDLREWLFCPGMLFGSELKWWGGGGRRGTAHEGMDLLLYRDSTKAVRRLDETVMIPAMYDGTVVRIMDDYLGSSIFMDHGLRGDRRLITAFGHTAPVDGIVPGCKVKERDIIATIAELRNPKITIAPHLHVTAGWVPADFDYEDLRWETIGSSEMIKLIDPLDIIGGDAEQLEDGATECSALL